MQKFVVSAACGVVALFVAQPTPADARPIGGFGSGGLRAIGIGRVPVFGGPRLFFAGRARYGLSGWYASPRFYRGWRRADYYPYTAGYYYYPYTVGYSYTYPVVYYGSEAGT